MAKRSRYVIWVHVKEYVKKYLLMNYRVEDSDWPELVNLSKDKELNSFITARLNKPSHRRDKEIAKCNSKRPAILAIEITEENFNRHGWALSPTDELAFNQAVTIRCDTMLVMLLSGFYMYTGNLMESIRQFYRVTGFTDDDWPMDSIRKKWLRDSKLPKIVLNNEINKKNTLFLLDVLSKNGVIVQRVRDDYERNLLEE